MTPPKEIRPGVAVAGQLAPQDIAALAAQGYRTIINNRPDGEEAGQMTAAEARAEAERLGMTYIHLPVTTATIGREDADAMARALAESPRPVVAHCRSGTRSYVLVALGEALAGADPHALVAEAAGNGYDLRALPVLLDQLNGR
jgi:sulfide:quinone oxidoreductase